MKSESKYTHSEETVSILFQGCSRVAPPRSYAFQYCLTVGCLLKTSFTQYRTDLESNIFHQVINRVAMVLE